MNAGNARSLTWLEYYGILRAQGKSPRAAAVFCEQPSEEAAERFTQLSEIASLMQQSRSAVRDVAFTTQANIISAVPVVGNFAARVLGWMRDLVSAIEKVQRQACEDDCPGINSWARRNIIGINPGPGGMEVMGTLIWSLHDGLVVDGLGGGADALGRYVGVITRVGPADSGRTTSEGVWSTDSRYASLLDPRVAREGRYANWPPAGIPEGNYAHPEAAPGNNFWYRAWRVQQILNWMENKMSCRDAWCFREQLRTFSMAIKGALKEEGVAAEQADRVADQATRRKGSRWYASMWQLHKDVWDLAAGRPEVADVAQALGETTFASEYRAAIAGKTYPERDLRMWPWWPITKKLSWDGARALLLEIAPVPQLTAAGAARLAQIRAGGIALQQAQAARPVARDPGLPSWALPAGVVAASGLLWYLLKGK